MDAPTKLRDQLQTLAIPKEHRPASRTRAQKGARLPGWVFALLVIGGLGYGGYVVWRNYGGALAGDKPVAEVRLITVAARPASEGMSLLTATGKIVSDHLVEVVTKVSGQIVALFFEQGDRVEKGQILARIEDVNYRARRDEAAAVLRRAEANAEYQKFNYERITRLHQKTDAADIELADAKRWYEDAQAQLAAAQAALDFAAKALADTEVVAPIAGVILERSVEVGDFVAAEGGRGALANAQFAVIADTSKLRVEVDVSELDVARLRRDMRCTVTPDAYKDRKYSGHVLWIDPGANYAKATVQVKVRVEQPDEFLRVEGSAQVAFLSDAQPRSSSGSAESTVNAPGKPLADIPVEPSSTIWIPASACVVEADGSSGRAFAAVDGRLKETRIRTGRKIAGQIEVLSGLAAGQQIAAGDLDKLKDGQRVR